MGVCRSECGHSYLLIPSVDNLTHRIVANTEWKWDRPDHFLTVKKMTEGSVIENLHIINWPTHCFDITGCSDLTIRNIYLDNSAGDAPNPRSVRLPLSTLLALVSHDLSIYLHP
jgi:hypothetical protein